MGGGGERDGEILMAEPPNVKAVFISTPRGGESHLRKLWEQGFREGEAMAAEWEGALARLKERPSGMTPEEWRREYTCEWPSELIEGEFKVKADGPEG